MKIYTSTKLFLASLCFVSSCLTAEITFTGFTVGQSIDGQGGWAKNNNPAQQVAGIIDELVVDDGGNTVWRVSNAVTSGSNADYPHAPRPAGIPVTPANDPVLGQPNLFAGESTTGAAHRRFIYDFDFKSATGSAQTGLSIIFAPGNGIYARMSFVDIEDNGSGLDLNFAEVDAMGNFVDTAINAGLNYTDWHNLRLELDFVDGAANDIVRVYLNEALVHTGTSWETYYTTNSAAMLEYPNGVAVQTMAIGVSGTAAPGLAGQGLYIDNVDISVGPIPEPGHLALCVALAGFGCVLWRRRGR